MRGAEALGLVEAFARRRRRAGVVARISGRTLSYSWLIPDSRSNPTMFKRLATVVTVLALTAAAAFAQNPRGAASTSVGGKKLAVDYGRPALKGRSMDELLKQLPADKMWRAGENQVTTMSLESDVMIGGKKVPAGRYSVYVHAGDANAWQLVLNKDLGVALGKIWAQAPDNMKNEPWPHITDYTASIAGQEVARIPLKAASSSGPVDMFTISFAPAGSGSTLMLAWGNQAWSADVQPAK
jgi:hypothetical protein